MTTAPLRVQPLTAARWPDLEALFAAEGCSVARWCWCMFYRRSGRGAPLPPGMKESQRNRDELRALVDAGRVPGLIAYRGKEPVGWVSLGPREDYAKLKRSPVMKAVDDRPVWSIGAKSMYDGAGFEEVARRKLARPIVRLKLNQG